MKAKYLFLFLALGLLETSVSDASKVPSKESKTRKMISQEQAVKIAVKRAKSDPYGLFNHPYVESVAPHSVNGNWVIKLFSSAPSSKRTDTMYMYITIDKVSGAVVSVDSGGGS